MRRVLLLLGLFLLIGAGGAHALTAAQRYLMVGGAPVVPSSPLLPPNSSLTGTIAASEAAAGYTNIWATLNAVGANTPLSEFLSSTLLGGTRVLHLFARGDVDREWAMAEVKWVKATVDSGSVLTFDLRAHYAYPSDYSAAYLAIFAYDSGGVLVNKTAADDHKVAFWGTTGGSPHYYLANVDASTLYLGASPTMDSNYVGKTFDVKSWLSTRYLTGKSWANVDHVVVRFFADDNNDTPQEFYVGNFR